MSAPSILSWSVTLVRHGLARLETVARHVAPPVARVALALPFLRSGLTRWDGFFSLSFGTRYLFEEQFRLHILGGEYVLPMPAQLALVTAVAEIALPIMLILGLGTRLAALGLLIMTSVIQLIFPEAWANFHLYWAALAISVLAIGPGVLSFDHWLMCGTMQISWPRATQ